MMCPIFHEEIKNNTMEGIPIPKVVFEEQTYHQKCVERVLQQFELPQANREWKR